MDFNDLNARLKRLGLALGRQYELDIKSNVKVVREVEGNVHKIGFSFGNLNELESTERILNVINNIASLKDHLKNALKKNKKNPQLVEDMIDNSYSWKLLLDLWNQDKHGAPLKKMNRSKKNPKIIDVNQGLVIQRGGSSASVTFEITENEASYSSSQNAAVAISGSIVDESGNFLISVENMFREALTELELFMKTEGLAS
jgi:hypothetical protein